MLFRVKLRPALIEIAELKRSPGKAKPGGTINDPLQRQTLKLSSARCPSAMAS
jgi:hypothetical protein